MGYNFNEDLKKAEISEMKFYEKAKTYSKYTVEDVRNDKAYQEIDVDFVMTRKTTGERINIEIKSDDGIAKYGNIL